MNVKAFRNGSFEIDFSAIALVGLTFLSDPLTFAESVVAVLKGFLEIKKLLKGVPPKSVEATEDGQSKLKPQVAKLS